MIKRRRPNLYQPAPAGPSLTAIRFEQLFHGLPVACFCCDTSGLIVEWNHGSEVLFGQSFAQVLLKPVWTVVGRPQDSEIVRALFRGVIDGQVYSGVELMDHTAKQETRYLLCSAFPLHDPNGAIIGGVCTCVDISERIAMEQALWQSEERWQLALRGNNDGIWDWNLHSSQVFVSPRWHQIHCDGPPETSPWAVPTLEQAISDKFLTRWFERVHPSDQPGVIEALQDHLKRDQPFYISEHRIRMDEDDWKWVLDRGQALWDSNGLVVRVAGSSTDITERKRLEAETQEANRKLAEANEKLAALATEDGLTGLKNHRAFQERLAIEVERARRHGEAFSLVLLDVDHFKQYNDTYGHPAGDAVLREVARRLEGGIRYEDLAARYGGEEFVLLLPHCTGAEAVIVAERCRTAIAAADWPQRPITASFGIASLLPAMTSPADLIAAADQALYAAKHAGRNQFAIA